MSWKGPTKRNRRELCRILDKWRPRLFLHDWFIDFRYLESPQTSEVFETIATCTPNHVYRRAQITVYSAWFKHPVKEREAMIVHELCHLVVEEAAQLAKDCRDGKNHHPHAVVDTFEKLVVNLTNIVFKNEW